MRQASPLIVIRVGAQMLERGVAGAAVILIG
jgi:hypothetical protein